MFFVDHFSEALMLELGLCQLAAVVLGYVLMDRRNYKHKQPATTNNGVHIVLTSNYKEERWMLERLIDSVKANRPSWPVYVVVAAERGSNLVKENWNIQDAYPDMNVHIAIHERGIPGERPGLGSNLHNAVKYINDTLPIDPNKAIITKIDGNCFVTNTLLNQIENAWHVGDENSVFQLLMEEIDPGTEEYKALPFSLKYGWSGYATRWLPYGNVIAFGGVGLMSAFCLPLQLVNSFGNWDPWIIQEDNLTWSRTVAGSSGLPKFQMIRSEVFNAPPITWYDQFKQLERSHGQSLRAHVIMYSNMTCSSKLIYMISGLFIDITSRWQGVYTVVFALQQIIGYQIQDWRVWIALLALQITTTFISALHQVEVHKPTSISRAMYVFVTFVSLQIPLGILFGLFNCYIYLRSWITRESYESYHTTSVVSKQ